MFTTATTIQHGHRILDNETALKSLLVTSTREISQINLADHQKVGPDEINFYAQVLKCNCNTITLNRAIRQFYTWSNLAKLYYSPIYLSLQT